jgi:hypothetical protein
VRPTKHHLQAKLFCLFCYGYHKIGSFQLGRRLPVVLYCVIYFGIMLNHILCHYVCSRFF